MPIIPQPPTRTQKRVFDILSDVGVTPADDFLKIVVDNVTIATHEIILDLWLMRGYWIYSQSKMQHYIISEGGETREIECGYIFAEWQNFIARNGENLKRTIDALYSEYNPIENYAMHETGADGEKEDKTHITPKGTTTVTTTPYATGINSTGDGAQTGKSITETAYTDAESETNPDNTKDMTFESETKSGYHKTNEHYFQRHGNIGVTTSMQMIMQEIDGRKIDLIADFTDRFFRLYCYFAG